MPNLSRVSRPVTPFRSAWSVHLAHGTAHLEGLRAMNVHLICTLARKSDTMSHTRRHRSPESTGLRPHTVHVPDSENCSSCRALRAARRYLGFHHDNGAAPPTAGGSLSCGKSHCSQGEQSRLSRFRSMLIPGGCHSRNRWSALEIDLGEPGADSTQSPTTSRVSKPHRHSKHSPAATARKWIDTTAASGDNSSTSFRCYPATTTRLP